MVAYSAPPFKLRPWPKRVTTIEVSCPSVDSSLVRAPMRLHASSLERAKATVLRDTLRTWRRARTASLACSLAQLRAGSAKIGRRMDQGLRAPARLVLAGLGTIWLWLLAVCPVSAQLPLEVNGLRGGRHVGSAGAISAAPRVQAGLGYAYTSSVLGQNDRHQRGFGELAAAYAPRRYVQLALSLSGRFDGHRGDLGEDSGAAFASELATRHAFSITPALSLGAQTRFRFPASASAGRGLRAVTPELGVLATYALPQDYELSANVGYRFDRSDESVEDASRLSQADQLAAALSRYDAALLGLLFSLPTGPLTTSLEWSWDVAVGGSAPSATQSPMRVRLATQAQIARRYVPGFELGVSPSARPKLEAGVRIEPRMWAAVNFAYVFEPEPPPPPARTVQAPSAPAVREPVMATLRVVDPAGTPVAGAQLAWSGEPAGANNTDAEGRVELTLPEGVEQRVTISGPGFEPQEVALDPARVQGELTVSLVRRLPDGEIKGKVRSLRGGRPLIARIAVEPLGLSTESDKSGDFRIDVPPGRYTLEITAEGHEPQQRQAQVELHGVTILVVDLRRAAQ
jgi:hypothetical protein